MSDEDDEIHLKCPACSNEHVYPVQVERSYILAMLRRDADAGPHERTFRRLFTCPEKGTQFQATLTLSETILDRIKSVSVGEAQAK